VISTRMSVIYTRRVRFPHAEWDFHTHKCDCDTQDCDFKTHKSDFYTQCDFDTYVCDYDTQECNYNTHKCDLHTIVWLLKEPTKIYVRSPKNPDWVLTSGYTTRTSVIFTSCVWFWHPVCYFNTHACDFDIFFIITRNSSLLHKTEVM
jgi:hypothetical protein